MSDIPLYQQIFERFASRIDRGELPPGARLPPTRSLAQEMGAHRNTIVRAYEDLEAAGFVVSTVGRGTFVAPRRARTDLALVGSQRNEIPWRSIVSNAATSEFLVRHERIQQRIIPGEHINLTRMQPSADLLPHDLLRRCLDHVLRQLGGKALGYAPADGLPRLRKQIAEDLGETLGIEAEGAHVTITAGSQQALDLVARAMINPGDTLLIEESTYSGAMNAFSVAGARLVTVPWDNEGPDMAALQSLARTGAKAFYTVPNCHNPTGRIVSLARREQLIQWSHENGIPLIEDDYGERLDVDGQPPLPPLRALDPEVVYLGSFSKKLIPALRLGFLLSPPALKAVLTPVKHAMDLGASGLMQYALSEFLARGYLKAHVAKTVPEYRRRRDALEAALREHVQSVAPGTTWSTPRKGVILWLTLPDGITSDRVFDEAQRRGVLVSPGALFTLDERRASSGIRLTYCAEPVERLEEGARALGAAIAAVARIIPGRTMRLGGI